MNRLISMLVAALLVCGCVGLVACDTAEREPENAVYVTVANGELVLTRKAVSLSDADGDGATTINDALMLAHDAAYEGGAAAGYQASESEWGLSLYKLWGVENGGSYGYRLNDGTAMSLVDPVEVGDHVYAYVYTDLSAWSDVYSNFDVSVAEVARGEALTLTLTYAGYDADWNPVTLPVADATVTVDGKATAYKTDADGKVTLTLDKKGEFVISATSEELTLVPPVCVATVK